MHLVASNKKATRAATEAKVRSEIEAKKFSTQRWLRYKTLPDRISGRNVALNSQSFQKFSLSYVSIPPEIEVYRDILLNRHSHRCEAASLVHYNIFTYLKTSCLWAVDGTRFKN